MIYFIQAENGGPIKIGYTERSLKTRLANIQVGHPYKLELICVIPGGKARERRIHNTFISSKLNGEWFSPDRKIIDYINYIIEHGFEINNKGDR